MSGEVVAGDSGRCCCVPSLLYVSVWRQFNAVNSLCLLISKEQVCLKKPLFYCQRIIIRKLIIILLFPYYSGQINRYNQQIDYSDTFSACWVFSCFRNPPNSDLDYMIFNVRTRSLLCVLGLGTPTGSQHNIFDSEKVTICRVLLTGFERIGSYW